MRAAAISRYRVSFSLALIKVLRVNKRVLLDATSFRRVYFNSQRPHALFVFFLEKRHKNTLKASAVVHFNKEASRMALRGRRKSFICK